MSALWTNWGKSTTTFMIASGKELIVTDDDISGTFTFLRALEDYGCTKDITPDRLARPG